MLWYLNWLDFEVSQGSLLAYLMNSHGRHAPMGSSSLRTIGATLLERVVDRAVRIVQENERAWDDRRAELAAMPAHTVTMPYPGLDGSDALVELTEEYWRVEQEEPWGEFLETYLTQHRSTIEYWAMA